MNVLTMAIAVAPIARLLRLLRLGLELLRLHDRDWLRGLAYHLRRLSGLPCDARAARAAPPAPHPSAHGHAPHGHAVHVTAD